MIIRSLWQPLLGNLELQSIPPGDCSLPSGELPLACPWLRHPETLLCGGDGADEERCRKHVEGSTATATALVPAIGYENATRLAKLAAEKAEESQRDCHHGRDADRSAVEEWVSPKVVCRLGSPLPEREERIMTERTPKGLRLHIGLFGGGMWASRACSMPSPPECFHCVGGGRHDHGSGGETHGVPAPRPVLFTIRQG